MEGRICQFRAVMGGAGGAVRKDANSPASRDGFQLEVKARVNGVEVGLAALQLTLKCEGRTAVRQRPGRWSCPEDAEKGGGRENSPAKWSSAGESGIQKSS